MTKKASEITGLTKAKALRELFDTFQKEIKDGEGPQSFHMWLESKSPELWIELVVWETLVHNRIHSLRKQIEHCQVSLDEHEYTSQTYPEIKRTQEDCYHILGELNNLMGIIQHILIE